MLNIIVFLSLLVGTMAAQIPTISNVSLLSVYPVNTTTLTNLTCAQCLCSNANINALAINCHEGNRTCQYFSSFPRTYRLQSNNRSRLYFPRQTLPPASRCCAANLTDLITRLANATVTSVSMTKPRCLVVDPRFQYLVTVEDRGSLLNRFHLRNLSFVDQTIFWGSAFMSISYSQEFYFAGKTDFTISVISSVNLTVVNVLSSTSLQSVRDMIFLQNGQMLVVASPDNNNLVFFNRSSTSASQYSFAYSRATSYLAPHGLWPVSDSFFYATSWTRNSVYAYSTTNYVTWTESLFINATATSTVTGGSHLTIDECQRSWFSLYSNGLLIYDDRGSLIGNFSRITSGLFDMIFVDNYVMYLSDNAGGKILRLDPRITC